jgi:phosphoenolpyruvate carboxylase
LGVGEAVKEVLDSEDSEILRTMYQEWGSFRTTLELVEMVLAKSEPKIAQHYEEMLVKDPMAQELGHHIRKIHKMT